MSRPARLSVTRRLIALTLIPLLALAGFAGTAAWERVRVYSESARLIELVDLMAASSGTVHHLQAERGATTTYVNTGGASMGDELPELRAASDAAIAAATGVLDASSGLPGEVRGPVREALDVLADLTDRRAAADGLAVPGPEVFGYYTGAVTMLLDALTPIVTGTTDADQARQLGAVVALARAKEAAGTGRAQLASAFGTDGFAAGQYLTVASRVASREAHLQSFADLGGAAAAARLAEVRQSPAGQEVARYEELALGRPGGGFGTDSAAWFATATELIDQLKAMEDATTAEVRALAVTMRADAGQAAAWTAALALAVLIGTAVLAGRIVLGITRPVAEVVTVLEALAAGQLGRRLANPGGDEIGRMGHALNTALDGLQEVMGTIETTSTSLGAAAEELSAVSGVLRASSGDLAEDAAGASSAAVQISANIQNVAAAGEQMGASIAEIARNASAASTTAASAVDSAAQANATVQDLGEASARIGDVLKTVATIARQTNLLALNATIEAARAGEAGKGFAVVAGEVKDLAQETEAATGDIAGQITGIQEETAAAVAGISRVSAVITEIDAAQGTIAAAVEEQTATTEEISRHVTEAATGSQDIAARITRVAQGAAEISQGAASTDEAAENLAAMAQRLQAVLARFDYETTA